MSKHLSRLRYKNQEKMNWKIKESTQCGSDLLKQFPDINPIILQLLFSRKIRGKEKIEQFLGPDYHKDQHDPYLMLGMEKAVNRILEALEKKEKIVVFGDYDVDGVCSSALMIQSLKLLGADVSVYIPDRAKEGYGMNINVLKEVVEQRTKLIITVDCGISDYDEVEFANENGIDVLITDHHPITQKLPRAFAIIDPHQKDDPYPFKYLAGVGVAYKLICALFQKANYSELDLDIYGGREGYLKWLLDLVALGTVADCCPLIDENRIFVKFGLKVLEKNRRIGITELLKNARIYDESEPLVLNTFNIGFQIGPRLNASGRMDHANTSYQLLITQSQIEGKQLADQIEENNKKRQQLTKQIIANIKADKDFTLQNLVFVSLPDCPPGIVGLIAGKLAEEMQLPAFIISEDGDISKGSARIPDSFAEKGFHLGEIIATCQECLIEFGGHASAAGFSVKDGQTEKFRQSLDEIIKKFVEEKNVDKSGYLEIDYLLEQPDIEWGLLNSIITMKPFGEGNPEPLFLMKDIVVSNTKTVGTKGDHLKINLRLIDKNGKINFVDGIGFGLGEFEVKTNDKVDVVFSLEENIWNNKRSLQLKIKDIHYAENNS